MMPKTIDYKNYLNEKVKLRKKDRLVNESKLNLDKISISIFQLEYKFKACKFYESFDYQDEFLAMS